MIRDAWRRRRFMREHHWAHGHLNDYLDGDLGAAERRRVESHAGLCPECRRLLAGLTRTVQGLAALANRGSTPAVTPSVLRRLQREEWTG